MPPAPRGAFCIGGISPVGGCARTGICIAGLKPCGAGGIAIVVGAPGGADGMGIVMAPAFGGVAMAEGLGRFDA